MTPERARDTWVGMERKTPKLPFSLALSLRAAPVVPPSGVRPRPVRGTTRETDLDRGGRHLAAVTRPGTEPIDRPRPAVAASSPRRVV